MFKNGVTLKKDGWVTKFLNFVWEVDTVKKFQNFCPLFWVLVGTIVFIIPLLIVKLFSLFLDLNNKKWINHSALFYQANLLFASVTTIGIMFVLSTIIYFARYDEEKLYDGIKIVRYDKDDDIKVDENVLSVKERSYYLKNIETKYVNTDTVNGFAADVIYNKAVDYNQWFIINGTLKKVDHIVLYNAPQQ